MSWIAVKDKEPEISTYQKGQYHVFGRCWIRGKNKWSPWSQGDAYYEGNGNWLHDWHYPIVQVSHYMMIENPEIDMSYDLIQTSKEDNDE